MTIRVLLADDQALLRGTFRMLFDSTDDMETVGEASNGQEALDLARAESPDVVLMDIRMPEMDGLEATRLISESEDLTGVKVLILTTFEDDEHVADALRAGASGFLGKGARPEELLDAVRTIAARRGTAVPVSDACADQALSCAAGPVRGGRARAAGVPDTAGTRCRGAGGTGAVERRDRRTFLRQPLDRQNSCQPGHDQAGGS